MDRVRRYVTGTNYCGPGGQGTTLGEVDAACKEHDANYNAPYLFDYLANQKADKLFLQRLSKAKPKGFRQHVTKFVAQRYFGLKTKLVDMSIRDPNQGSIIAMWGGKRSLPSNVRGSPRKARVGNNVYPNAGRALLIGPAPFIGPRNAPRWIQRAMPYYRGRRVYYKKTKLQRKKIFLAKVKRMRKRFLRQRRS